MVRFPLLGFFSNSNLMNKSIELVRKDFMDDVFRMVGFRSMEDAMKTAQCCNYEFSHEQRDKITTKLKKEKVKKCHIDAVQDVLSGYELEDNSSALALQPKFAKKIVPHEEFLQTGIPFISLPRDWSSYEQFMKRDIAARSEQLIK